MRAVQAKVAAQRLVEYREKREAEEAANAMLDEQVSPRTASHTVNALSYLSALDLRLRAYTLCAPTGVGGDDQVSRDQGTGPEDLFPAAHPCKGVGQVVASDVALLQPRSLAEVQGACANDAQGGN